MDSDRLQVLPLQVYSSRVAVQLSPFYEEVIPSIPKVVRQYTRKKKTKPPEIPHTSTVITGVPAQPSEKQGIAHNKTYDTSSKVIENSLGKNTNIHVKIEALEEKIADKKDADSNKKNCKAIELVDEECETDANSHAIAPLQQFQEVIIELVENNVIVKEEYSTDANSSVAKATTKSIKEVEVKKEIVSGTRLNGGKDIVIELVANEVTVKDTGANRSNPKTAKQPFVEVVIKQEIISDIDINVAEETTRQPLEEVIVKEEIINDTNIDSAEETTIQLFEEVLVKEEINNQFEEVLVKTEFFNNTSENIDETITEVLEDEVTLKEECPADTFQNYTNTRNNKPSDVYKLLKIVDLEKEVMNNEYNSQLNEEFDIKDESDFEMYNYEVDQKDCSEVASGSKVDVSASKPNETNSEIRVIDCDSNILGSATTLANGNYIVKLKKCYLMAVDDRTVINTVPDVNEKSLCHVRQNMIVPKKCNICNRRFVTKASLRLHQKDHFKLYSCRICSKVFKHCFKYTAHLRRHSRKDFKCELCAKEYKYPCDFSEHLNTHSLERQFICPICQMRFTNKGALQRHVPTHKDKEVFPCKLCEEKFPYLIKLNNHAVTHSNGFPCEICGDDFKVKAHLERHKKIHYKILECAFCTNVYPDELTLQKHAVRHIIEMKRDKQIRCRYCNKTFAYQSVLITHERSHTDERPFPCHICEEKFKTKSALTGHVTKHSRPYKCNVCALYFGRKDILAKHYKQHTGEKPYECNQCDRSFVQKISLNIHMEKEHGVEQGGSKIKRKKLKKK